jgi:arylsulfatase A-like enzyme
MPDSLVLVTVDCLRADHTGFLGCPGGTTPFLDSLAPRSLVFRNAMASGVPTYYSLPAILASRSPLALGRDVIGLAEGEPTLASVLSANGYATAAFSAANPYISPRFGYDAGFGQFNDFLQHPHGADRNGAELGARKRTEWNSKLFRFTHALGPVGAIYDEMYFRYGQRAVPDPESIDAMRRFPSAAEIVDHAERWLQEVRTPFFLWLHFMDPHSPYYPSATALEKMGTTISPSRARYLNSYWNRGDLGARRLQRHRDEVIALYDAGVRFVDMQLARLCVFLEQRKLWDHCVLAVTADHGEEFLEHGGRYHAPEKLSEELTHVPLLIRVPACPNAIEVASLFGLIDLAPTLLALFDIQAPASFAGHGRWQAVREGSEWDDPAIAECVAGCSNPFRVEHRLRRRILMVRGRRHKLVIDFRRGTEDLFDLLEDPAERCPLQPEVVPAIRATLLRAAYGHLQRQLAARDESLRLGAILRETRLEWMASPAPCAEQAHVT